MVSMAISTCTGHVEFHDRFPWCQLANFPCQYLGRVRLIGIEGQVLARKLQSTDYSTRCAVADSNRL